jgi:hypothetical protein
MECPFCGSRFMGDTKWPDKKPIIDEELALREGKYIDQSVSRYGLSRKPLNESLKEFGTNREQFDEALSALHTDTPISPYALASTFLSEYQEVKTSRIPAELSPIFALEYIISRIPQHFKNYDEVRKIVSSLFQGEYRQYIIDYHLGSGWFPLYSYPVRIEPFWFPVFKYKHLIGIFHDAGVSKYQRTECYRVDPIELCCFTISLPDECDVTLSQMEKFWSSLQSLKAPVVFEIVGNGDAGKIIFQFLCGIEDKANIVTHLQSIIPDVNPEGSDHDYFDEYDDYSGCTGFGSIFGLEKHCSYPLRTFSSFRDGDPLTSLMTALSEVKKGETAIIQAIIQPVKDGWDRKLAWIQDELEATDKDKMLDNIAKTTGYSEYKFENLPIYDFVDCPISHKLKYPLFSVALRTMVYGEHVTESFPQSVLGFSIFGLNEGNSISDRPKIYVGDNPNPYKNADYSLNDDEFESFFNRTSYRHGFILNSEELANLLHFPSKALKHPKLLRQKLTFAKAPEATTAGDGLLIGVNEVFGQSQKVYVPEDFRFRHVYVVGKTGTGKTTLLLNMIKSDIDAGKGVGLIDPHGDLVERVLQVIPENRIDDVILFDPTDYEHPIGFNMFQVSDRAEERQMRSDIVVAIRQLFESSSWGDNIDHLFRTSVATLLADQSQKHTILDLRKLISDDVYRSQILVRLNDDYLKEFWVDDFPGFAQSTVSAVKRRLASVLGEPEVRNVLGQSQNSFNFKDMMDKKKIFLANLSRGILGENISSLFGGLLVSKIQLTAMARASQPEEERVPFYLYVDEFQNFVNESFEVILSEARKYKLCLTITHQFTGQLPSRLYDAVFGNIGSLIVFEVGVDDATSLEKQLGKFTREDILNLERFHTFTRIGKSMDTFSMRTFPDPTAEEDFSSRIRQASREKYCSKQEIQPVNAEEQVENDKTAGVDDFFERDK